MLVISRFTPAYLKSSILKVNFLFLTLGVHELLGATVQAQELAYLEIVKVGFNDQSGKCDETISESPSRGRLVTAKMIQNHRAGIQRPSWKSLESRQDQESYFQDFFQSDYESKIFDKVRANALTNGFRIVPYETNDPIRLEFPPHKVMFKIQVAYAIEHYWLVAPGRIARKCFRAKIYYRSDFSDYKYIFTREDYKLLGERYKFEQMALSPVDRHFFEVLEAWPSHNKWENIFGAQKTSDGVPIYQLDAVMKYLDHSYENRKRNMIPFEKRMKEEAEYHRF